MSSDWLTDEEFEECKRAYGDFWDDQVRQIKQSIIAYHTRPVEPVEPIKRCSHCYGTLLHVWADGLCSTCQHGYGIQRTSGSPNRWIIH